MIRKNLGLKYSCVKPEDVKVGESYSFSYNPEDQPLVELFYKVKLNTFSAWSRFYYDLFKSMKYCQVHLQMEISSGARLHYHGYIIITDIVKFFMYEIKRLRHYGTYEIDTIKDRDKWEAYIDKQGDIMKIFCAKEEMQYEIDTIDRPYDIW